MSTDTEVYGSDVEKCMPPQTVPPETKGEALGSIQSGDKKLPIQWSTRKLCFQPGMSLMSELPALLQRCDEPYEDEEGAAVASAHWLQYENLMAILGKMDREFMLIKGVAF